MQTAADVIGFNKDYFCRFFKQYLGVSFVKYLNHVKMDHIYHDLIETDEEILQILEKHGFENQKLFYKMFRDSYGCSPREFRIAARNHTL